MAALTHDASRERVIATMEAEPHSRYPVIGSDRHDVIGVVSARALLLALLRGETLDLARIAKAPVFVPESLSGRNTLERFREGRTNMAFVVDEYGSLQGLVTLHDVLEGITGEFSSGTTPDQGWAVQRPDGSWLFDGQIPLTDLSVHLGLEWPAPDGHDEDFETLSGLIYWRLGRIPRVPDAVAWQGWTFEVVDMDAQRIDKVLAVRTV